MSDDVVTAGAILAAIGSGIIAGVFFTFSVFVMTALRRVSRGQGMPVMQAINITVLHPLFLLAFMGTAALSLLLSVLAVFDWDGARSAFLLAGSACYLIGTLAVTIAFNVPRNNELATADAESDGSAEIWQLYQSEWTRWNHVRTFFSTVAMLAFMLALR